MLDNLFGKLQDVQAQNEATKTKLEGLTVVGEAEGIRVTSNGNSQLTDVHIPAEHAGDAEALEDLILLATNRALDQARALHDQEMADVARGMLGGLGG